MRHFFAIATLLLATTTGFAYNPFWTNTDKKLITAVIKLDKLNPKQIEYYFKTQRAQKNSLEKENLGFGWTMWAPGIGGGYISISAKFYYYNDSLISYTLTPRLPEERGLKKRYKKWYGNYFYYSNAEIQPFKFNEVAILRPLQEYRGSVKTVSNKVINYMTPNSGTMYGYGGGGVIMQNRKAFLAIKDSLTNDEVIYLMYSINPASRLTAIDYYLENKSQFDEQSHIDNWIEAVFKEIPTIKTMSGCFLTEETTETLFPMFYLSKYYR